MVTKDISKESIDSGKKLLEELDRANVNVDAAFWFFFSDASDWKLVFSLPQEIKNGPKKAYAVIQKAYSKIGENLPGLDINDVLLMMKDNSLIDILKTIIRTGPGISQIRLSQNMVNGTLIEDAIMYRLL